MSSVVSVSPAFRRSAVKAIFAIVLFVILYLVIVLTALGLTVLCSYLGLQLIIAKPAFITLMLGAGLVSFGILILIFVVKFIFKQHKTDISGMIEVQEEDQPELFAFIREIVESVGTHFPKRIYLSADVNASVFYDSSMLSMFLPVKKNLNIGLGLVNSVNKSELKAILAHEFGHFSQRSMKIGSYVYNVNRIIHNLLYDNGSYEEMIRSWSGLSNYISIFVMMAVKVVKGIQWCLSKMYHLVNLQYMNLSRAMEFHADEVAASVAGSQPLITSLMRISLAEHSYGEVLRFYGNHIQDGYRTENIYPLQREVMFFQAEEHAVNIAHGLPLVTVDHTTHFNKSKLVIRNQWASHPETEERVANLNRVNMPCNDFDESPASRLFYDIAIPQKELTTHLFSGVNYNNVETKNIDDSTFLNLYVEEYRNNNFPKGYESFYDYHNPHIFDLEQVSLSKTPCNSLGAVFTPALGEFAADTHALKQDAQVLRKIENKEIKIKSFDYDGQKYSYKQAGTLAAQLEQQLEESNEKLKQTDLLVYSFFVAHALAKGKLTELKEKYKLLFAVDQQFDEVNTAYVGIRQATQFLQGKITREEVSAHLSRLHQSELPFRQQISVMLDSPAFAGQVNEKARQELEAYLHHESLSYFNGSNFSDSNLQILFAAINQYEQIATNVYFDNKQKLLRFQEELVG
jgi:Zn-dependent protease with chaperone function